jgi:ATP-dependent Clp protease adapter protein ClpS
MPQIIERPELDAQDQTQHDNGWAVTVFNNETNTYEEVISILTIATHCSEEEAYIEAWEIDNFGQCMVHRATEEECKQVAQVIATIGIRVETGPE